MTRSRCIALTIVVIAFLAPAAANAQEQKGAAAHHELVHKGRVEYITYSPGGNQRATEHARRAIDIDPRYGPAWALLADALIGSDPQEAKKAGLKAVELDPTSAVAWTALARAQQGTRDFASAETSYLRAIGFDPSYSNAYGSLAQLLPSLGRAEEGLRYAQAAYALDPSWADASYPALFALGRFDDLIKAARAGIAIDPNGPSVLNNQYLGYALLERGENEEALRAIARQRTLRQSSPWTDAWAYARAGRVDEARRILADLVSAPNPALSQQTAAAALYAHLGKPDSAFIWLEQANPRGGFVNLRWHPMWAPIRSDPRFNALTRKVGVSN